MSRIVFERTRSFDRVCAYGHGGERTTKGTKGGTQKAQKVLCLLCTFPDLVGRYEIMCRGAGPYSVHVVA